MTKLIISHRAHDEAILAKPMHMAGYIQGSPAKRALIPIDIPKYLSEAKDLHITSL